MKVTLRNIMDFKDSYFKLLDQSYLPIKIRRTLTKDGKKIIEEIEQTNKLRNDLIMKYGEKSKDGTMTSIDPNPNNPKTQSFQLEYSELLDVEIDLETDVLDIEDFMKEECTLSPKDFILLEKIISEKQEKNE